MENLKSFTACNLFPVTYVRNVHTEIYSELLIRNSPMMLKPNNCVKYKINHSCQFNYFYNVSGTFHSTSCKGHKQHQSAVTSCYLDMKSYFSKLLLHLTA